MMVRLRALWELTLKNSLLLAVGTVAGLVWANVAHPSYERFAASMHFAVNDVGMVFFFALAVKEIVEATLPGGALESPREAAVPIIAAAGGMIGPAVLYAIQATAIGRPELMPGWAIPCATDIAFSYLAARFIFPRNHPAIPFLLLLAIADDALGLILLALFYPVGTVSLASFAALMLPAVGLTYLLRQRRITNFWPYLILGGGLSWAALFFGGIHPALAMVPILPLMPHEKRDLGLFDPREHDLPDTMNRFEQTWRLPVQFILLFFGLVNAGVTLSSVGSGSWIVFLSLLVGKPIGIVATTFVAIRLGLRMPGGLSFRHAVVMGVAAGIGFTVALFFATSAFRPGPILDQAKMGALLSFFAAPIAIGFGRVIGLRPDRAETTRAPRTL